MLVITVILGLESMIRITVYFSQKTLKLVLIYIVNCAKFLLYEVLATLVIIGGTLIILFEGASDYKFYPYFILIRVPFVIKPIIYVIFYKFLKRENAES
jgi:hypothetical protein